MKAIATYPGTGKLTLVDQPDPTINSPDEVVIQMQQVGICGTDREEAQGGRANAPEGKEYLVIGHEMLGKVVETGKNVTNVQPGDLAVLTVRRGCGKCRPCIMGRPDLCQTGEYKERGIKGLDGYQTEMVVDRQAYVIRVPPELNNVGVLTEPLSVVEKAIDQVMRLQEARLPDSPDGLGWWHTRRCLIAGLGPIGLLAALSLRLRGAKVFGLDILDQDTPRPRFLQAIGGKYIDGREVSTDKVDSEIGPMEVIFESTGKAALEFNLLDALGVNGIYVLTGIPSGNKPLQIPGPQLIRQLVLSNQIMIGSVNASIHHFQMAVTDLEKTVNRWDGLLEKLITHHYHYTAYEHALLGNPTDEIKTIIQWEGEPL